MRICVYGAASPEIDNKYIEEVEKLGVELAKRGHSLVFGGGSGGLMGAAARGVTYGGGHITGIIPSFFENEGIEPVYEYCDEVIETKQCVRESSLWRITRMRLLSFPAE